MSDEIDFHCHVCGKQCDSAPPLPERAVCPDHCPDHEYVYERGDRTHYCKNCGQQPPDDYYDENDIREL